MSMFMNNHPYLFVIMIFIIVQALVDISRNMYEYKSIRANGDKIND